MCVWEAPGVMGVAVTAASRGSWLSPVTAHAAASAVRLGSVRFTVDGALCWTETHPADEEQVRILRRSPRGEVSQVWAAKPAARDVGGSGCWLPVARGALVVAAEENHRLSPVRPGSRPKLLTPDHVEGLPGVFTEVVRGPDPEEVRGVRECWHDGEVVRQIVTVPLDGSGRCGASTPPRSRCPRCVLRLTVACWRGSRGRRPRCRGTGPSYASGGSRGRASLTRRP